MLHKNQEVIKDAYDKLSKEELIEQLNAARAETFKYVNRVLEVEEKWSFINVLLKKLNSIKQKQKLCKTITDGFLTLTASKACACCLFNPDNATIEAQCYSMVKFSNQNKLNSFISVINEKCEAHFKTSENLESIQKFFESVCTKNLIIVPITSQQLFLGYLFLYKEDENFYKENINFINIFPEHIALILENISLYQESEKRNKRKIEFLAGISHEFKTPLNSVIGFAQILQSEKKETERKKYLNNILQSSKHLLTIIEDVLDVSKTQAKPLELNYTVFNPKGEITQILQTLDRMIAEKNIKLTYTLIDLSISADIKRFRQLIYNLVSNAIKFNKQGGKINILTYISENDFVFDITDTGDGISKRDYDKIFDFFSQVNRNQLKRQLGSGVGLALCKRITEAHGGSINFKSQLKKGSSFWFSIPTNSN